MLLVWENADPELPLLHARGAIAPTPRAEFFDEE
jgi:hypothetical protein